MIFSTTLYLVCAILSLFNFNEVKTMKTIRLEGLGATFPASIYENWLSVYDYSRRNYINLDIGYNAVGSLEGVKNAVDGKDSTDFTTSEILLKDKDYEKNPDLHMLPVVAG